MNSALRFFSAWQNKNFLTQVALNELTEMSLQLCRFVPSAFSLLFKPPMFLKISLSANSLTTLRHSCAFKHREKSSTSCVYHLNHLGPLRFLNV